MKKILILTSILIITFSFKGCLLAEYAINVIINALSNGLVFVGDSGTEEHFSIYVGDNGVIFRSSGDANIVFQQKSSGTTQRLNNARVLPTTFEPITLAVWSYPDKLDT